MEGIRRLPIAALLISCLWLLLSQPLRANEVSFEVQELAPKLYMLSGKDGFTGGNIVVLDGQQGSVMIDDALPDHLALLVSTLESMKIAPMRFLLNTHFHADHIGNNEAFGKAGAQIVSHENLGAYLAEHGIRSLSGNTPVEQAGQPMITYSESLGLHLNGHNIEMIHLPAAHTSGDSAVVFKDANIIHLGDVFFNGLFPFIDLDGGGTLQGYIAAQQTIIALSDDNTILVPGHGPVAKRDDLQRANSMLVETSEIVQKHLDEGKTPQQIMELNPLEGYEGDWSWGFITTEKMTMQLLNAMGY